MGKGLVLTDRAEDLGRDCGVEDRVVEEFLGGVVVNVRGFFPGQLLVAFVPAVVEHLASEENEVFSGKDLVSVQQGSGLVG